MDKQEKKKKRNQVQIEVPHKNVPEVQQNNQVFENVVTNEVGKNVTSLAKSFSSPSKSDVLGSYTGNATDKFEKPVQDADDL